MTVTAPEEGSREGAERVTLAIDGMTCAACAARIERKLNRLEGVEATVNYATEAAAVAFDPTRASLGEVMGAVEAVGYHASLPAAPGSSASIR